MSYILRRKHPLYPVWCNMKQRCYNSNNTHYSRYGGRGIHVCSQWLVDFEQFVRDMGPRPDGYTLDRIDVNGNYTPNNCRWASKFTQAHNTSRKLNGHISNISKYRPNSKLTKPWRAEFRRYNSRVVKYFGTKKEAREWLNMEISNE